MEIEKIFKNLILLDFIILLLIVISSIYEPKEFSEVYQYLDKGLLSSYEEIIGNISNPIIKIKIQGIIPAALCVPRRTKGEFFPLAAA